MNRRHFLATAAAAVAGSALPQVPKRRYPDIRVPIVDYADNPLWSGALPDWNGMQVRYHVLANSEQDAELTAKMQAFLNWRIQQPDSPLMGERP